MGEMISLCLVLGTSMTFQPFHPLLTWAIDEGTCFSVTLMGELDLSYDLSFRLDMLVGFQLASQPLDELLVDGGSRDGSCEIRS